MQKEMSKRQIRVRKVYALWTKGKKAKHWGQIGLFSNVTKAHEAAMIEADVIAGKNKSNIPNPIPRSYSIVIKDLFTKRVTFITSQIKIVRHVMNNNPEDKWLKRAKPKNHTKSSE